MAVPVILVMGCMCYSSHVMCNMANCLGLAVLKLGVFFVLSTV